MSAAWLSVGEGHKWCEYRAGCRDDVDDGASKKRPEAKERRTPSRAAALFPLLLLEAALRDSLP
jgi:hypothetical protein